MFLLPCLLLIGFSEPSTGQPRRIEWRSLATYLAKPARRNFALVVAPLLMSGVYLLTAVQPALLLDRYWDLSRIGVLQGVYAPLGGVCAGLLTGLVISRRPRRRSILAIGTFAAVSVAALIPLSLGHDDELSVRPGGGVDFKHPKRAFRRWLKTVTAAELAEPIEGSGARLALSLDRWLLRSDEWSARPDRASQALLLIPGYSQDRR